MSAVTRAVPASSRDGHLARIAVAVALALTAIPFLAALRPTSAITFACGLTYNCATITVLGHGNGSGTVTSNYTKTATGTARIDCRLDAGIETGNCSQQFAWPTSQGLSYATLTLTPDAGSLACPTIGPGGCSAETQPGAIQDQLSPGEKSGIDLQFQLAARRLSITGTGTGTGTVETRWLAIDAKCAVPPSNCIYEADYGTVMTLTATPDAGAVFSTWTGACAGQGATCHVSLDSTYPTITKSTNVVFQPAGASVTPAPARSPRPTSSMKATAPAAGSTSAPPTPEPTFAGAAGATLAEATAEPVPTPGASLAPASSSSDAGMPLVAVVVIAVLALLVGALAVGLAFALRRRPS